VGIAVLSIDLHSQMASSHAGLATALAAVRSDVARPWRLAELAEIAGLSTKQLQRLCRGTLGLPPQQVIQRMRLEEAVRLATSTDATFGQIAADCGFYDQASFTRQFRKVLGVTPRAYRSRAHARQRRGR
jgi:transcriptional regulator GlxA family with amidase domain